VRAHREGPDGGVGHRRHGAGHGLREHDRERVQVGAAVEGRAGGLLGRRVARRADHRTRRLRPARFRQRPCQAEVGDAHDAVLVEQEVGGLDVAVDEAAGVRVLERGRDLAPDVGRLRRRAAGTGVEEAAQAAPLEQLEDHERDLVVAPVVDRHDVGVVQGRGDLGLGAEPPEEAPVVGEAGVEDLHRHPPAQLHVVGHVDATARARADGREHAVPGGEDAPGELGDAADRHRGEGTGPRVARRGKPALPSSGGDAVEPCT
jgi:hypothetical protein